MSQPVLNLGKDNLRNKSLFDVVPDAAILTQLVEMGFIKEIAEQALIHTKNKNLQVAMDWLLEHPEGISVQEHQAFLNANTPTSSSQKPPVVVSSTTPVTVQEPKPEIHLESRYAKMEEEKKKYREKMKQQEVEKSQRERKEKQLEKERVLKRMQEDKEEKKKKLLSPTAPSTKPISESVPMTIDPSSTSINCVLQVRLPSGQVEKLEFKSHDTLKTVHNFISKHFTHHDSSFLLLTTFPKREFRDKDLSLTLAQADLAPRGTLVVQMMTDKGVIKRALEVDESALDTDAMSYEQLLDLGDKIGSHPIGASETRDVLPVYTFDASKVDPEDEENALCLICQCEYEDGDTIKTLTCKHAFHRECIDQWLNTHKSCPVCKQDLLL